MTFRPIATIAIIIILVTICFCTAFLAFQAYDGEFTPVVEHLDFRFDIPVDGKTNWQQKITFKSKGAFIAGEKIDVNVKFDIKHDDFFEIGNITQIWFSFEESFQYPITIASEEFPAPLTGGGFCYISDKNNIVDFEIVYTMPGIYGYTVTYYQDNQVISANIYEDVVTIAPLETRLEIRNSNVILALTFVAIFISFLSILVTMILRILDKNKK